MVLPNFLIIGALRSGTTSLARYLGAHPQVSMAAVKEVHFFDHNFDKGLEWYADQFARSNHRAVGEATPNYIYLERAFHRLARTLPDARLIVVLREPVARAYSHYWMMRSLRREVLPFQEAIQAEPDRLLTEKGRERFSYLDRSRYLPQLNRVLDSYAAEQVCVVLFEHLREDPLRAYRHVCRFLGVDEEFLPPALGEPVNAYVTFRSLRLRSFAGRLPFLPRKLIDRMNTRLGTEYPALDEDFRAALRAMFTEGNVALASRLNLDLSLWG